MSKIKWNRQESKGKCMQRRKNNGNYATLAALISSIFPSTFPFALTDFVNILLDFFFSSISYFISVIRNFKTPRIISLILVFISTPPLWSCFGFSCPLDTMAEEEEALQLKSSVCNLLFSAVFVYGVLNGLRGDCRTIK